MSEESKTHLDCLLKRGHDWECFPSSDGFYNATWYETNCEDCGYILHLDRQPGEDPYLFEERFDMERKRLGRVYEFEDAIEISEESNSPTYLRVDQVDVDTGGIVGLRRSVNGVRYLNVRMQQRWD